MGRRKLTSVSTTPAEIVKPVDVDVYQRVVAFEEAEAKQRSAEKDAALFHKTCEEIRQLFSEIAELKQKNTAEAREDISVKRIEATLLLVTLKKLNRLEKFRTKAGRDALHKEKQRLDSTHLLLQNLLYETDHLDKEVTKCLQFKSKDEEIDLVSVEEFYKSAPVVVTRPALTKTDDHQLRLARLEWELRQRRELSEVCSQLQETARGVSASLAEARARLDGLAPRLKDALAAAEPLREALGLTVSATSCSSKSPVNLLPPPLFLLHARAQAYAEAFGHHLVQVAISGDEDEAHRLEQIEPSTNIFNDSDSDGDSKEEEDGENKKRHHRSGTKISKEERAQEKLKAVIKAYPLVVQLVVKLKEASISLSFSYLIHLKIVTVQSSIELPKPASGISSADVLNSHSILHGLYPGDYGTDSPHLATGYILRSAGVEGEFSQFIPQLGHPYIWAQRMCGLDFLASTANDAAEKTTIARMPNEPCPNLSGASVESVLITLQKRLKAKIVLMRELQDLESGNIPSFEGTSSSSVRLLGSLTQWQAITWADYSQALSVAEIVNLGLVSKHDMLYRAIITRQSAKLVALVALKSDYPKRSPIFSLTLHWNGTHHAGTDDDIRDIERCVNTDWCNTDGSSETTMNLPGRLTRLLACMDILLEALGSSEFPPDKVMFRPVKGRNRIKPYKYLKQGSGVFTQY